MNMNRSPLGAMTTQIAPAGARLALAMRRGLMSAEAAQAEPVAPAPGEAPPQQQPVSTTPAQPPPETPPQPPAPQAGQEEQEDGQAQSGEEQAQEGALPPLAPSAPPPPLAATARSFAAIDADAIYARLNGRAQALRPAAFAPAARPSPLDTAEIYRRLNRTPLLNRSTERS